MGPRLLAILFAFVVLAPASAGSSRAPARIEVPTPAPAAFTSHAPIAILRDADFTAANGVTGGTGTTADPYIIEGWDISALNATGIQLQSTTAHVVLRQLTVHDGGPTFVAIFLYGASNVTVDSVNATTSAQGVYLYGASDVTVRGSNGSSNQGGGVSVVSSRRVLVDGNFVRYSSRGVLVDNSSAVVVSNNRIRDAFHGVEVATSPGIVTSGNDIANESWSPVPSMGIRVQSSDGAVVTDNAITSVAQIGVWVSNSNGVSLNSNLVAFNGIGAELLESTATITHNRFYYDAIPSIDTRASFWDAGYPTGGNAWSEYYGMDRCRGPAQDDCTAADGIGDTPYLANGTVRDRYPLVTHDRPPLARVTASPSDVLVGRAVTFSAAVLDPDGTVTSYAWDFGDGSTGQGAVAAHAYAASGTFSVTLTVTDNRSMVAHAAQSVRVWPAVSFIQVEHPSGFRVPLPVDWEIQKDAEVGGERVPVVALGPTADAFRTNILVSLAVDPAAREDRAYLAAVANDTLAGVRQERADAYLADGPTYLTISGHGAVAFRIAYGSLNAVQRVVIVVSAIHGIDWLLLLSVAPSAYGEMNATFDAVVSGFQITLIPSLYLASAAVAAGALLGAAACYLMDVVVRGRGRGPSKHAIQPPSVRPERSDTGIGPQSPRKPPGAA